MASSAFKLLQEMQPKCVTVALDPRITNSSSPAGRVALFRSLYRRDRRKDALLQQHGYFVLRFLAEDAGKQLDYVLDAVLAALAHRHSQGL